MKLIKKIKSDPHFSEIIEGGAFILLSKVIVVLFSFFTSLVIANYYGAEIIGLVAIINSVMMFFSMFGVMGINGAALRLISEYSANENTSKLFPLLKQSVKIVIIASVISGLVLFLASSFIASEIFSKDQLDGYLVLAAIFILPASILALNSDIFIGLKLIRISAISNLLLPVAYFLFVLILTSVAYNKSNPVYALWTAILVSSIILTFISWKKFTKISNKKKSIVTKSHILSFAKPMFITSLMHYLIANTDIWILGAYESMDQVGIYSVAVKLTLFTNFVLIAVNTFLAPKLSELFHSHQITRLKKIAQKTSKLIFFLSLPLLMILVAFGTVILNLFGSEFTLGFDALVMLTVGQLINIASGSVGIFLNMTGQQNLFRNIVSISAVINIVLNFSLIPQYGINGAAFSNMVCIILWNVTSVFYIKKKFGFTISFVTQFFGREIGRK